ncbi:hypothetical protein ERJ75_000606700 [Trypanosoma vivax]|nr:hypothetical protein ERJ75_000606700 [Trypanosoma vivax]
MPIQRPSKRDFLTALRKQADLELPFFASILVAIFTHVPGSSSGTALELPQEQDEDAHQRAIFIPRTSWLGQSNTVRRRVRLRSPFRGRDAFHQLPFAASESSVFISRKLLPSLSGTNSQNRFTRSTTTHARPEIR